jgi:hypothetical protein
MLQEAKSAGKHTSINCKSGRKIYFRSGNSSTDQSAISGGNFGIRTSTPAFNLDVNGEVRQNLPFFCGGAPLGGGNFQDGNTILLDGTHGNVLTRNGNTVEIPTGADGIYHIYGMISQHCLSSTHDNRGVTFQTVRNRGGTITTYCNVLQWIDDISGSSYRQQINDLILDLQGGDIVYWDTTNRANTTDDLHKPNTHWYVKMIMPT